MKFTHYVPCAGCGAPTPYEVAHVFGEPRSAAPAGTYGEWLRTPLGDCFHRTHSLRECVLLSRAAVDGRPFVPGPSREDRGREQRGAVA